METFHKPVLVKEVLEYLDLKPGGTYVDVTFGGGGHTRAILETEPDCQVIGFDWDMVALERNGIPLQEEFPDRLRLIWGNFAQIDAKLKKKDVELVDGILADFGTSQYQLTQRPGFSFYSDTPLDMRMSPPHQKVTAADVLNKSSEKKLYELFKQLGEEPYSKKIAHGIVEQRAIKPFQTTKDLSLLIEKLVGWKKKGLHPATRVFQALRIYVNKELDNIYSFLPSALRMLKPGGRLVCISFHSLEDRIVKQFFKDHETKEPLVTILTPKVIIGSDEEIKENPSARSAKLRAVEMKKNNSK